MRCMGSGRSMYNLLDQGRRRSPAAESHEVVVGAAVLAAVPDEGLPLLPVGLVLLEVPVLLNLGAAKKSRDDG